MNLLQRIIAEKKKQVATEKLQTPVNHWEQQSAFRRNSSSLKHALKDSLKNGIIAEFKRRSPSKGIINDTSSVTEVTAAYTAMGASGLSVLTDKYFFGGSIEDLKAARRNQIPILRKDFIIDEYQIVQSKAIGADVILLIAACLTKQQVQIFSTVARNLGMETLLEVHDKKELDYISNGIELVGINNRDLKTFAVDVNRSTELAVEIKRRHGDGLTLIAESGISNIETIEVLRNSGFSGFLIGENFMKQKNPGVAFAEFVQQLKDFNVNKTVNDSNR